MIIFIPCENGLSHNKEEAAGANMLLQNVDSYLNITKSWIIIVLNE